MALPAEPMLVFTHYLDGLAERPWVAFLAIGMNAILWSNNRLGRFFATPNALASRAIDILDRRYNRKELSIKELRLEGVSVLLTLVGAAILGGLGLGWAFHAAPYGWLASALVLSTQINYRGAMDEMRALRAAMARSTEEARATLALMSAQETGTLDDSAIVRTGIRNLVQSFSRDVVAPLAYFLLFGLAGAFAYKVIATGHGMIGNRTAQAKGFGWSFKRLSFWLQWPAARLALFFLASAALQFGPKASYDSLRTAWRGARRHALSSAGWLEGAMAGALGLEMGGRQHDMERVITAPPIGDGRSLAEPADLDRARRLVAGALLVGALALALVLTAARRTVT
ncbi:MAG: cobalamin biosynthesis protein CobD/CbiB [Pseudomonadota bacterium]